MEGNKHLPLLLGRQPISVGVGAVVAIALTACDNVSAPFKSKVYTAEDCIIDGMKGVQSDLAARAVVGACREKYPAHASLDQSLPSEALANVKGNASLEAGKFAGTLKNDNTDWIVTEIKISLGGDTGDKVAPMGARSVTIVKRINPQESASFTEDMPGLRTMTNWEKVSGRGIRK